MNRAQYNVYIVIYSTSGVNNNNRCGQRDYLKMKYVYTVGRRLSDFNRSPFSKFPITKWDEPR